MNTINRDLRAADILSPDWLPTYQKQIEELHLQASDLSNNIFLLKRITTFPFHLFHSEHYLFWWLASKALYEASVLCAWRIAIDNNGDFLTIRRFKNEVLKHIIDDNVKKEMQKSLKALDFEAKLKSIKDRIPHYRHQRLAHFRPDQDITPPFVIDIEVVSNSMNELINFLGFERKFSFLFLEYYPNVTQPVETDTRPDIEKLLDDIVKNDWLFNMPENEPDPWKYYCKSMVPKDIDIFNFYRAKYGLSLIK